MRGITGKKISGFCCGAGTATDKSNVFSAYIRSREMLERIETLATDNTYGGTELSAEATVTDANAQFAVIKKTSSTASTQILFSKPIEKLRKGLYSLLLRLKVTSITDSNGLIELKVTSGGTVLETRTITAQMFEKAGTFQTFGLNVELSDTATITATLLKNSANITVSVDYVMLQPAQTAITSL